MDAQSERELKVLLLFDSNVGREVPITPNPRWRRDQERRLAELTSLPQVKGVLSLHNFGMLDRRDDEIVPYLRKWIRRLRKLEDNHNTQVLFITRDRKFVLDSGWSPDGLIHICVLPSRVHGAKLPVGAFRKTALIGLVVERLPAECRRISQDTGSGKNGVRFHS